MPNSTKYVVGKAKGSIMKLLNCSYAPTHWSFWAKATNFSKWYVEVNKTTNPNIFELRCVDERHFPRKNIFKMKVKGKRVNHDLSFDIQLTNKEFKKVMAKINSYN